MIIVISKKKLITTVLATICVTSTLSLMMPIGSLLNNGGYDPWIDTNDDGIINYQDLGNLASRFGAFGAPINKTDLILELQETIESLNDTVVELQSAMESLLSHNETYSTALIDISGYPALNWQNMSETSVEITLTANSTLLIMFSAQARVSGTGRRMIVRATVDANQANTNPVEVILTESDEWESHSYTFYSPNVAAGTHTINMQWKLWDELSTGQVKERTLTVMALPT
ncbi:MAG: hypothetical protein JSW53_02400 [Candidatus Bathyarchaeota archaeon]|nr:MAG: hypothetical protein JSW53_02400 [Candidatus Bathyarchaeota archaeon]